MSGLQMSDSSQAGARPVHQQRKDKNELAISYMFLGKTVGWIGTLLPVVLIAGNVISLPRCCRVR